MPKRRSFRKPFMSSPYSDEAVTFRRLTSDKRHATLYDALIIKRFRHKGLKKFFSTGDQSGIRHDHANRLQLQLTALEHACKPQDMNAPNWRLHPLEGKWVGFHAIIVNANWRLIFRFDGKDATDVDYLDYH